MGNKESTPKDFDRLQRAFLANRKDRKDVGLMKPKDFKALQKQIQFEYPELASVRESMLVTDNRLPDCPIVFANDQFERMTLYPKEAILGVNCRFLQGPLSDKKVVQQIRAAVDNSEGLDVELLNYRSDGVPFWNLFLMLPVHKSGKRTGKAKFFIAIQKDVSLIKGLSKDADQWSAPEVCMWLERRSLTLAVARFFEERIEGHQLEGLDSRSLRRMGFLVRSERRLVLNAIAEDFMDGQYIGGENKSAGKRVLEADTQVAKAFSVDGKAVVDLWGSETGVTGERIAIKCQLEGAEPVVFLVATPKNFAELQAVLFENLGRAFTLHFEDEDGDQFPLETDDDFETVLIASEGQTFTVIVSKPRSSVRGTRARALDRVGVPVIHVDAFGLVSFANEAAIGRLNGSLQNARVADWIPVLGPKRARQVARLEDVEVHTGSKESFKCNASIASCGTSCVVTLLVADD